MTSVPDFFICGPLYTERSPSGEDDLAVEFRAVRVTTIPGTDQWVAFGFVRLEGTWEWSPAYMDEFDFFRFTVKGVD